MTEFVKLYRSDDVLAVTVSEGIITVQLRFDDPATSLVEADVQKLAFTQEAADRLLSLLEEVRVEA